MIPKVHRELVFRSPVPERLMVRTELSRKVAVLRLFPSISIDHVKGCLQVNHFVPLVGAA